VSVLLVFADGLGVGPDDPEANPVATGLPAIAALAGVPRLTQPYVRPGFGPALALDAALGMTGLPQSATGQTTLLTGFNAAAAVGGHVGPFLTPALRALLARSSLWRKAADAGLRTALANAYPDRYLERAARGGARMGAFARSALEAGVRLRGPDDLRAGRATSAFFTNLGWREHLGYDIEDVTPAAAGRRLGVLAREHDLTIFETYATDVAGHARSRSQADHWLAMLDEVVAAARGALGAADVLLVASDHGNVEDLTSGRHTTNPALGVWTGPPPDRPLGSLTDLAGAVMAVLVQSPA
jgi:hypothetical protein